MTPFSLVKVETASRITIFKLTIFMHNSLIGYLRELVELKFIWEQDILLASQFSILGCRDRAVECVMIYVSDCVTCSPYRWIPYLHELDKSDNNIVEIAEHSMNLVKGGEANWKGSFFTFLNGFVVSRSTIIFRRISYLHSLLCSKMELSPFSYHTKLPFTKFFKVEEYKNFFLVFILKN